MSEDLHRHFQVVVAELGITPIQAAVLRFSNQPIRMGTLAEKIRCQPSHITGVADSLEERGWVTRERDPEDRRVQTIVRTSEGQKAGEEILDRLTQANWPMLDHLTEAEQTQLLELLYKAIRGEGVTLP